VNFNEFAEIKKIRKNLYKNSLNVRVGNKPTTTTEEFDAFRGFMLIKNMKQTYKGGLHFTVICCTNKCIINEPYIPQHQNRLS